MESYISAPLVHANAVKNPKMLGGPFMDYGGQRVGEVIVLRERIKTERRDLIKLSTAFDQLDNLLASSAKGHSLGDLYERVPEILKGYVELVYDLNNHPSFRLIEPLLYRSPFYLKGAQSLMLSTITGDDRPFVLSTPRLDDGACVKVNLPFDHSGVDELFSAKTFPRPIEQIRETLGLPEHSTDSLLGLVTTEAPREYHSYDGNGIRWRYFGHACILVEFRGFTILMDPVLSYTYETQISRYTYEDLPPSIDCVLITHNHQDHVLFETLLQVRHKVKHIVVPRGGGGDLQDPSLKLILQNCGFANVQELGEMEEIQVPGGAITGIPFLGEHADLDVRTKLAYLIRHSGRSLLFAADSCNLEAALYRHVHSACGDVDALFVGMECVGAPLSWLYGPLLTRRIDRAMDESRRLAGSNFEQAMNMVECLKCREVYVYAMGQEPWLNYVMSIKYTAESLPIMDSNRLIAACRDRGINAERLFGEKEILLD
jgi:L-ascorbate metabolism protein UlaG (beta-lactamase superfamily)